MTDVPCDGLHGKLVRVTQPSHLCKKKTRQRERVKANHKGLKK